MAYLICVVGCFAREEVLGNFKISNIESSVEVPKTTFKRGEFKPLLLSPANVGDLERVKIRKEGDSVIIETKFGGLAANLTVLPRDLDVSSVAIDQARALLLVRKAFSAGSSPLCIVLIERDNVVRVKYARTFYKSEGLRICEVISIKGDALRARVSLGVKKYEYVFGDLCCSSLSFVASPDDIKDFY